MWWCSGNLGAPYLWGARSTISRQSKKKFNFWIFTFVVLEVHKVIPLPCPLLEQPKGSWQPCEYHRRETRDKGGGYSLLMARTPQSIKHCHLHLSWEVNDGRNKLVLLFPDNISIQDSPLRNGMSWRISFTKSGPSGLPNTAVFSLDALGYVTL